MLSSYLLSDLGQSCHDNFHMRIYTKKGDGGQSSLFGGSSVSKTDPRLEAYGTLDELNAAIGLVRSEIKTQSTLLDLDSSLFQIQNYLFHLGSHLAVGDESLRAKLPPLDPQQTLHLEAKIDHMEAALQPLTQFILPGGTEAAARLHLARTVARRAERRVVSLGQETNSLVVIYLNRLSDFLFVAARWANHSLREPDVFWGKS